MLDSNHTFRAPTVVGFVVFWRDVAGESIWPVANAFRIREEAEVFCNRARRTDPRATIIRVDLEDDSYVV